MALLAGLSGCPQAPAIHPGPNILLITLDTTRADRIGAYGYASGRTPALDRLAGEGVLFEHAYAPAPLTLPSHTSMLTGLYPPEHGLRTNGAGTLPDEQTTLAELLSAAGYDAGAFVASYVLDHLFGLKQGFAVYDDDLKGSDPTQDSIHRYRDGKLVVDAVESWLAAPRTKPFFCWAHLYDPHAPYDAHAADFGEDFAQSPYDGEIAYTDRLVGRLTALAARHPQTVIVVAGDHGEGLGDHSELQHGYTVYHSTLHVPLIVYGVAGAAKGRRVAEPVSLVDLFATILETAKVPAPETTNSRSLLDAVRGEPLETRGSFAMTDDPFLQNGWSPLRGWTTEKWQYIRTAKPELYDLAADPGQLTNLAEAQPEQVRQLENELADFEAGLTIGEAAAVQLSAAEQRALASLGYLGGAGQAPADVTGLADVKDMLPFNVRTETAMNLMEQGRMDEAETLLDEIVAASPPQHYVSRLCLGSMHEHRGRPEQAEAIYLAILKERPDNTSALYPLGGLYAEQEKFEDAHRIYEQCRLLQPDSAQPYYNLGLLFGRIGDLASAQQSLEAALQRDAAYVGAWVALGNVYARQGRVSSAIDAYETELSFNPVSVEGHVNLAVQLAGLNRLAESRTHLEEAARLAPDHPEALLNLAICCNLQGEREQAVQHLQRLLEKHPDHARAAAKLRQLESSAP
ncbi:MAG: sulfatase-like hydrolase/transferase [Planctomycetaceae bacterium]|nr:sulfatase-like hydrolase/transferase [Planctomycetaceae bacterium]